MAKEEAVFRDVPGETTADNADSSEEMPTAEELEFAAVEEDDCATAGDDIPIEAEDSLQLQLEKVLAAKDDLEQRYLRLQADFDNHRRRTRKEQQEFAQYAAKGLITQLLPVLDNYQRALDTRDQTDDTFSVGIEMIYKQLISVLEQEGLAEIEAEQQQFDPQYHEAVMQVTTDEYPDNTVIEVLQRGYKLKDKVIRPAMVKVAKG